MWAGSVTSCGWSQGLWVESLIYKGYMLEGGVSMRGRSHGLWVESVCVGGVMTCGWSLFLRKGVYSCGWSQCLWAVSWLVGRVSSGNEFHKM